MDLNPDEISVRGQRLYEQILPRLEPARRGDFIVINVETGEYELDPDDETAAQRASQRFGAAPSFAARVG